jgi:putative transposase
MFPVTVMCDVLKVSPAGYYAARDRSPSRRVMRHERIKQSVAIAHADSHGIYGSIKVAGPWQERDDLESACRNTVATAMREMGLESKVAKTFRPTTTQADPSKQPAENRLDRDFTATAPNRKWVTDITYLPTARGWAYLSVVLDLFGRKVVGWSIGDSLATELVSDALRHAIESRQPDGQRLLHHSDRGCQSTSDAYQTTLRTLGIACSMSRNGNCWDNAVRERFFWSLKHEWTKHESFDHLEEARLSVFKHIETFCNRVRVHQTLGYTSPDQYEADYATTIVAQKTPRPVSVNLGPTHSLSLRNFLFLDASEESPDHSSLTKIRQRLLLLVHEEVFACVLDIARQKKLLVGKQVGIDSTTLEANAAMKSIVRRDSGEDWKDYLRRLAEEAGVEIHDDEDLRRFDKQRKKQGKKKVSNDEWVSASDPESRIINMKDGRTHLDYKAEHVVDLESEYVLAATVYEGTDGDG